MAPKNGAKIGRNGGSTCKKPPHWKNYREPTLFCCRVNSYLCPLKRACTWY